MLRDSLNFAAHPIRNYALYSATFRTAFLALAGVALVHGMYAYFALAERAEARGTLDAAHREESLASLELSRTEERLQGVEVEGLHMKASWINALIGAHRFSWTAFLDDLEDVLTPNVFVQTIAPSPSEDGTVELRLSVVARTPADLADFLDALEDARRDSGQRIFARAYPAGEKQGLVPNVGDGIISDVSVTYLPEQTFAPKGGSPQ